MIGLGLPNDNKRYVHEGITDCVVLWNTMDLGYLTVTAAAALKEGTLEARRDVDDARGGWARSRSRATTSCSASRSFSPRTTSTSLIFEGRIAAVVLEDGGTLVTRNLRDFRRIPNLAIEDWTA